MRTIIITIIVLQFIGCAMGPQPYYPPLPSASPVKPEPIRPEQVNNADCLEKAINHYDYGRFASSIETIFGCMENSTGRYLSKCNFYLGVNFYVMGNKKGAIKYFKKSKKLYPGVEISTDEFPPDMVELFNEVIK